MEKILTISIAAYNAELDIKRCLDSFISTNVLEELELIVVNDGSKDNTLNVAKQYEKKYPGIIKVIDKKNGGHQHLKVVTRIINYYSDKKRTLKEPVQEIILNRIHSAILSQYKIYANMEPKESIAEVKKFDMWLKQFPELYTGAQGRFMKIIYLNRATRFMFYAPIIRILKIMHLEPKI